VAESSFVEVKKSDEALLGNRQIIVVGFKAKEQTLIKKMLKKLFIEAPIVFPKESEKELKLLAINELESGFGYGDKSSLYRAIIVGGITNKEFQRLMARYKKSSLERPLWATLTETSMDWTLGELLSELARERMAMG
jgi:hypothetical protein